MCDTGGEMQDEQRSVVRNAFNKETFIFSGTDDPEVARFDVILGKGGSGGGNALVHVHPFAEERFVVRAGRIKVVVEGREQLVGPGQEAVVPRGKPHFFMNAWDGDTELTVEFRPPQQHLLFFYNFARLTADRPEWFSKQGDPKFLLIAATLGRFKDHIYLARPPIVVQKILFAVLAPVARRLGYDFELKPVHG
jgi:mannose-6-phosphate isomerase-like protein (cupin superfamily)